jgi:hypothetical protein
MPVMLRFWRLWHLYRGDELYAVGDFITAAGVYIYATGGSLY